jgi:hypothetical protein
MSAVFLNCIDPNPAVGKVENSLAAKAARQESAKILG